MDIAVRTLRRDEMPLAVDAAASEGWNPGLHDADAFFAADPGGFLVAEHRGQPVGFIGAVSYAGRFGFIGFYIVAPEFRGRGIGMQLWNAGMARLAGHVVGLDGVPAQQANYRKSGFRMAWRNVRCVGPARRASTPASSSIVPLAEVDFDMLCADDRRVFPAPRDDFLRAWIAMPDATGLAWMEEGRLRGWGVIRTCGEGHKIGPLVADDAPIARALHAALCDSVPEGDAVFLDVPVPNAAAMALAASLKLRSVFETARMYAGAQPAIELQRVYGITSFELG